MLPPRPLAALPLTFLLALSSGSARDEPTGPTFVRVRTGPEAAVKNAFGERVGSVHDCLIDRWSGRVTAVALSVDALSRTLVVPYEHFAWVPETRELRLPLGPEALEGFPLHRDPSQEDERATKPPSTARALLCDDLYAQDGAIGPIAELLLEPRRGTLAFVLVEGRAADPYVFPWEVLSWRTPPEHERARLGAPLTREVLADAPTLRSEDLRKLESTETLVEVFGFFELQPPYAPTERES